MSAYQSSLGVETAALPLSVRVVPLVMDQRMPDCALVADDNQSMVVEALDGRMIAAFARHIHQLYASDVARFERDPQGFYRLSWPYTSAERPFNALGAVEAFVFINAKVTPMPPVSWMAEQRIRHMWAICAQLFPNLQEEEENLVQAYRSRTRQSCTGNMEQATQYIHRITADCLRYLHEKSNTPKELSEFVQMVAQQIGQHGHREKSILTVDLRKKRFSYTRPSITRDIHRIRDREPLDCKWDFSVSGLLDKPGAESAYFKYAVGQPGLVEKRLRWTTWVSGFFYATTEAADPAVQAVMTGVQEGIAHLLAARIQAGAYRRGELNVVTWNHQLLTSRFVNRERRLDSYQALLHAWHHLDGTRWRTLIDIGTYEEPIEWELQMGLFNAGINRLGTVDWDDHQPHHVENRKAFFHAMYAAYHELNHRIPEQVACAYTEYHQARRLWIAEKHNKAPHTVLQSCDQLQRVALQKVETAESLYWQSQSDHKRQLVYGLKEELESGKGSGVYRRHLWIQIFRLYLQDLYYTYAYRDPTRALLFHAYLLVFQQLIGITPTVGCKNGRERTAVVCAMAEQLMERVHRGIFVPAWHEHPSALAEWIGTWGGDILTQSGFYACIQETGGGTPQMNIRKFPILAPIARSLQPLTLMSEWAIGKMHKWLPEIWRDFPDAPA